MTACRAFLLPWCVVLPLLGNSGNELAQHIRPVQNPSAVPELQPVEETEAARNELDFWVDCPEESKAAPSLCRGATDGIDQSAERALRELFHQDISEKLSLCAIDAALTKSQRECPGENGRAAAGNLAQLMVSLADEWNRNGVAERAEQLFAQAYDKLSNPYEQFDMGRHATLFAWTKFEIERNDLGRAYELAAENTAGTRWLYEEWPLYWAMLADALEVEARVLERLSRIDEARVMRGERAELLQAPNKAKTCWRNSEDRVVCRSESGTKFMMICEPGSNGEKRDCRADQRP